MFNNLFLQTENADAFFESVAGNSFNTTCVWSAEGVLVAQKAYEKFALLWTHLTK